MASYLGDANQANVVVAEYSQPVDVTVHVQNRGHCPVVVQLAAWDQNQFVASDMRTIRPPSSSALLHSADVQGDGIRRVTISCSPGQGGCIFDYSITVS